MFEEEINQAPKYTLSYFLRAFQVTESFDRIDFSQFMSTEVQDKTWIRTLFIHRGNRLSGQHGGQDKSNA